MDDQLQPEARQVVKWLVDGHDSNDVAEALEKEFPDADRKKTVQSAVGYIRKQGALDHAAVVGWAAAAYRELYRKMVQVGDFANAIRAVKELTALLKIKPPAPGDEAKRISIDDIEEQQEVNNGD